jgi:hypothetical protein
MIIAAGSLEYAQARLSARYGERPDEIAWRRIEHVRTFPALLDAARTSALGAWLSGIGPGSTPHEIEEALRGHWRDLVMEVASWMPDEWHSAVRWCAMLVDLPVLQHLARGGAAMAWMREDAVYRDLCERESAGFGTAPVAGPLASLTAAWSDPDRVGQLWLAEWMRRIPDGDSGDPLLQQALGRVLASHLSALRDPSLGTGTALRRALQTRLEALFRRAMLDPAAAFVFIALSALDLERFRGELLRRAAFPGLPLVA